MSTVIIRNGSKLCAKCRDDGCERVLPGWAKLLSAMEGVSPDKEEEYVSDEPCDCCERDFEVNDGFGA